MLLSLSPDTHTNTPGKALNLPYMQQEQGQAKASTQDLMWFTCTSSPRPISWPNDQRNEDDPAWSWPESGPTPKAVTFQHAMATRLSCSAWGGGSGLSRPCSSPSPAPAAGAASPHAACPAPASWSPVLARGPFAGAPAHLSGAPAARPAASSPEGREDRH